MSDDLTPEQDQARTVLHDTLQQHAHQVGPDDGKPVFLEQWVLVAAWTDAEGESFLSRITSKSLPIHAREGLLHQGLYGWPQE